LHHTAAATRIRLSATAAAVVTRIRLPATTRIRLPATARIRLPATTATTRIRLAASTTGAASSVGRCWRCVAGTAPGGRDRKQDRGAEGKGGAHR